MRRGKARRMHSEDARFLRDLLVTVLSRVDEIENAVGAMQRPVYEPVGAEVIEL